MTKLVNTGLADSGLSTDSLSQQTSVADNLVIDYPLRYDLIDQKGTAGGSLARSTSGDYDSVVTGLIATATANNPRFENDGLLCEGAATNYLLHNDALDNAAWNVKAKVATPTQDGTLAPDGVSQAWKIECNSAGAAYLAQVTGGGDLANSGVLYMRYGNTTEASWGMLSGGATPTGANNITLTEDGAWQKSTLAASSASDTLLISPNLNTVFGAAADGDYIYVWSPNMQDTAFATSPITTTTGTVTRTQETATLLDDNLPAQNAAQTWCFTFQMLGDTGSNQQVWRVLGETNARKAVINTSEQLLLYFGSNFSASSASTVTPNEIHRAVMRTDGVTNFDGVLDGTAMTTAAIASLSGATNDIGINVGAAYFNIKDFQVYNAYLTDAQLEEIGYG